MCVHDFLCVFFSSSLFMPVIQRDCMRIRFLFTLTVLLSIFFYLKRIILWRVTSKVLRETSLTTNFLPLIFFRVPFGKKITVPKESTWMEKKSTIELRRWCTVWSVKLEHAIWWILDFFRKEPSRKPHCPWIFRSMFFLSSV